MDHPQQGTDPRHGQRLLLLWVCWILLLGFLVVAGVAVIG